MKIIKKILFPIDFTDYSVDLLEYVIMFSNRANATLHLLNVIVEDDIPKGFDILNEFFNIIKDNPEYEVQKNALDGLNLIKVHIKSKSPSKGIVDYALENDIDLIMIPAHRPSCKKDAPLGETASQVVKDAPCPVMIMKLPEEMKKHFSRYELSLDEIKKEITSE